MPRYRYSPYRDLTKAITGVEKILNGQTTNPEMVRVLELLREAHSILGKSGAIRTIDRIAQVLFQAGNPLMSVEEIAQAIGLDRSSVQATISHWAQNSDLILCIKNGKKRAALYQLASGVTVTQVAQTMLSNGNAKSRVDDARIRRASIMARDNNKFGQVTHEGGQVNHHVVPAPVGFVCLLCGTHAASRADFLHVRKCEPKPLVTVPTFAEDTCQPQLS